MLIKCTITMASTLDILQSSYPLALQIREQKQMRIEVTLLNIGNLSLNNGKLLVAEALGIEDDKDAIEILATTVHKKTNGNAFFV